MNVSGKIIVIYFILSISANVLAKEIPFTLEDRDRIIRLEAKLEGIDKRFEGIDKRFEQIDKRLEQMMSFIWIIAGIFTAMTGTTIGFAIWDRRTMIRPFEYKVREIEDKIRVMEPDRIERLIQSLKEIAKVDTRIADALKKFNLL